MWKYAVVGLVAFAAGVYVAKLGYEAKVRGGIDSAVESLGDKIGVDFRGGFVEQTLHGIAGVQ